MGGGSWSAMMTAREALEKATSRCKISRRRRSLLAQRAEGETVVLGDHQTTRKGTRLDDAGDKKPEARTEDRLRTSEDA